MTQFSPIDEKYLTAARSLGMKNPEKMHPDMLMRTLGALTSSPQTAKQGAIASDYRGPGDQARAIASVARRNGLPFHAGLLRTGIPGMAAPVGRSKHQHGNAVDVSENTVGSSAAQGLYSQAQNFGLRQPLPRSDRNHIELDKNAMGPFPAPGLQNYIEGKQMDEDWLAKYGTPNKVNEAQSLYADARSRNVGENGRLDPSAFSADELVTKYGLHPKDAEQIAAQNGNMALFKDMMSGTIKKPEKGWGDYLGAGLQALAIPVSYAQNNGQYGGALMKDNIMTRFAEKDDDYKKLQQQSDLTLASGYMDRLNSITGDRLKRQQKLQDEARDDVRFALLTGRPVTDEMRRAAGMKIQGTASAATGKVEMAPDEVNGQTDPGYVPPGAGSAPAAAGGAAAPPDAAAPPGAAAPAAPMPQASADPFAELRGKRYAGGNSLNDISAIEKIRGKDAAKYALESITNDPAYKLDMENAKNKAELQKKLTEDTMKVQKAMPALEMAIGNLDTILNAPDFKETSIGIFDAGKIPGTDATWGEALGGADSQETQQNIRAQVRNLALAMKPFVRGSGEGPWTDADQRYLLDVAADEILRSPNKAAAQRRIANLKNRIQTTMLDYYGIGFKDVLEKRTSSKGVTGPGSKTSTGASKKTAPPPMNDSLMAERKASEEAKVGDVITINGKKYVKNGPGDFDLYDPYKDMTQDGAVAP